MNRKTKFWLLFLLGTCVFMSFFVLSIMVLVLYQSVSPYGILFSLSFLGPFVMYCYLLYRFVYKGAKPKYPLVPPEGRTDIYFPRTDIPRPIHEDARRYPQFFRSKKNPREKKRHKERNESTGHSVPQTPDGFSLLRTER